MKKVTLREYAQKNKLSYFTVMKMVRNGEVNSETVHENGKDVSYILLDDTLEVKTDMVENDTPKMTCEEENIMLKQKIVKLEEALAKCNRRTIVL